MKKTVFMLLVAAFVAGDGTVFAQAPRPEPESFIQLLQEKLDEIKKIKESMYSKLAEKDAVIADLQSKASAGQQEVPMLKEQLDAAKSENQKLEGQLKNAVNQMEKAIEERDRIDGLMQSLQAENQDLKSRASDCAAEITGLRDLAEKEKQELKAKLEKAEAGRRFLDMGLQKINESMDDILGGGAGNK